MINRGRIAMSRLRPGFSWPRFGRLEWVFVFIAVLAAGMRLWELDGRTMHYDEAIHLHFAWKLAQGVKFVHSPWMHGPLQIELVAAFIKFIGDTDFIARLPYALFGVGLVVLPYFLREQIGRWGAAGAAMILAMSPTLLYFSRFGRNDILMAVWALLLLVLFWRYTTTGRNRYLYWSALVVALMLATKETAFFIILFLGVAALAMGHRDIWEFVIGRRLIAELSGAAGFFVFLAALTLPQAAAMASVMQDPLGLTLVAPDQGSTGETGAPVWGAPFVTLPVWEAPAWVSVLAAAALVGVILTPVWWAWRRRNPFRDTTLATTLLVATVSAMVAVTIAMLQPFDVSLANASGAGEAGGGAVVNFLIAGALIIVAVVVLRLEGLSVRRMTLVLGPVLLLTWLWLAVASGDVAFAGAALPEGVRAAADLESGLVAVNYLIPVAALLALLVVSVEVGVGWRGGVWLAAAGIFYLVWTALYTTLYTNAAGIFTGSWQSLGYWMAQQGEARGNQPWYYYAVGLTVYELLALVFGLIAVVWLIRRRERFGLALAGWVVATLAVYTIAGEKMPWLLVNITPPLALAAGMYLGHLAAGVTWHQLGRRNLWLMFLAPMWVGVAVWVAWLGAGEVGANIAAWLAGLILLPAAVLIAWLLRGHPEGGRAAALGVAALLLLFGTVAAIRVAYTYDDSNPEILAYAQGSSDLLDTYGQLEASALEAAESAPAVKVDYDMWYPFQWYVRHDTQAGKVQFDTFCGESSDDDKKDDDKKDDDKKDDDKKDDATPEACRTVGEDTTPAVYLAESGHAIDGEEDFVYGKIGPMRNLLWYPETYRRPGESREETSFGKQLARDVDFFVDTATDPNKWRQALSYIVTRHQHSDWYRAEYYQYDRQ